MEGQRPEVIIVGGGPVGLSCSILLSIRNIPHVLFERHEGTAIHPKACGINQRTVEVFRVMGVEDEVRRQAAPPEIAGRTAWYTSLGVNGRHIVSRDAWGGGAYAAEYETFSPCSYTILPQIRLEPILKRRALELNPTGIFSNAEVLTVSSNEHTAQAHVRLRDKQIDQSFQARYLLVADGGRGLTDQLGIPWLGERDLFKMCTAHIRAPLRAQHPDSRNFITWFSNPSMGGSTRTGYLYQIGPWPLSTAENEEWVFVCGLTENDPQEFDKATILSRIRTTLDLPDLQPKLLSLSHWNVNAIYAETWRQGRIFLVGDSAHKIPPWGALGMNSGIQDAQNLIWKLQLALEDEHVFDHLLDTYEEERLAVGRRVGLTSLHNMRSHSNIIDRALGIDPQNSAKENERRAASFLDSSHSDHAARVEAVERAQRALDTEFKAPGYEVGWVYPSADLDNEGGPTHGGQQREDGSLVHDHYFPQTTPGHHLPHVWLEKHGQREAIRDLLALDKLTLFVETRVPHGVLPVDLCVQVTIGPQAWRDPSDEWSRVKGVSPTGGVLARPDGIVAWRGELKDTEAASMLAVIHRVLRYKVNE